MKDKLKLKQMGTKVLLSMMVQFISLLTSFVVNLLVPKYVNQLQYSYWQSYVLYASYVGIFHFGVLDGIVLKYSQYDYDELDKKEIRSQFRLVLWGLSLVAGIFVLKCILWDRALFDNQLFYIAISVIVKNVFVYTSYVLQISNSIKQYAKLVIEQRLFFGIAILVLIFLNVQHFYVFCIADLAADILGVICSLNYTKDIFIGKKVKICKIFPTYCDTLMSGIMLMIANFSNNFIVGISKILIQNTWDDIIFAKVSFGFSITNLFLTFTMAISVVFFPTIKRMNMEELPRLYASIRKKITPILLVALLLYFPGCVFLKAWLPDYYESLLYLGVLLPIIVFSSRTALLTNNYLKAYRKERLLLRINVVSLILHILGLYVVIHLNGGVNSILAWTVFSVMMKALVSEFVVLKIIKCRFYIESLYEIILSVLFMYVVTQYDIFESFLLYGMCLGICLISAIKVKRET